MSTAEIETGTGGKMAVGLPFAVAIFTSAFLVFQVQPVIARFILPWYGGTPGVWTTSLLFFQLGLLVGYVYAHVLAKRLQLRHQVIVHGSLLVLSLLVLPITPELPDAAQNVPQTFEILGVLALSVGFPFILLSASAPLFQHWFSHVHPGKSPFRLYALSNVGSLLALLGYPFLVEPSLGLTTQTWTWSLLYVAFIGVTFWCAMPLVKRGLAHSPEAIPASTSQDPAPKPSWFDRVSWMVLAACGSVVLLAITNQMTQDIAVIPFLWVVPLSLYLITFIICFERDAWYKREIWIPFLALSVGGLVYLMSQDFADYEISLGYQIVIYCGALFGCCMICHGEMVRRRPRAGDLTTFYVYIALGGALGGVFVSLIAPLLFNGYWELHGSLVFVSAIASMLIAVETFSMQRFQRFAYVFSGFIAVGVLVWFLDRHITEQQEATIFNKRSFFGILHVQETGLGTDQHYRSLYHGRIKHGEQWLHESEMRQPTAYYGRRSGVALVLNAFPGRRSGDVEERALRVGTIGLGIGTIAAFGRPNDFFRFYEIDPEVETTALDYFRYLDNSEAKIEVVIGDGRRSMQSELDTDGSQQYDVIIVDAFSGDAIPIHLLTQEASDLYWRHLKEDGILVLHISNLHVDLSDVVRQMAIHAGKDAIFTEDEGSPDKYDTKSDWVIITNNQAFLDDPDVRRLTDEWHHELRPIIWTDDFSNLFEVVDW